MICLMKNELASFYVQPVGINYSCNGWRSVTFNIEYYSEDGKVLLSGDIDSNCSVFDQDLDGNRIKCESYVSEHGYIGVVEDSYFYFEELDNVMNQFDEDLKTIESYIYDKYSSELPSLTKVKSSTDSKHFNLWASVSLPKISCEEIFPSEYRVAKGIFTEEL